MYDTPEEILRACVDRLGGCKRVGVMLWPELEEKPEKAGQKLSDHLNEERREKLSTSQEIFIFRKARDAGFHEGMYAFNRLCGYSPSKPLNEAEELIALKNEAIQAIEKANALSREMLARMQAAGLNVEAIP